MNLGRTIGVARKLKGLRQADVAAELEVSVSLLSMMENGKREVPLERLQRLAEVLGVPLLFIFVDALEPSERSDLPDDLLSRLDGWRMNVSSSIVDNAA